MKVIQSCLTFCDPMDHTAHGILQARMVEWVVVSSLGDLPKPGIEPTSPALQADSSPAEPQVKPKNTEVGSLSLLQRIFLTQELNQGLLHCRWILYKLSYQGSSVLQKWVLFNLQYRFMLVNSFISTNPPLYVNEFLNPADSFFLTLFYLMYDHGC